MSALGLGEGKFGKIWYYSSVLLVIEGMALFLPGVMASVVDSDMNLTVIFFMVGGMSLIIGFLSIFILGKPARLGYDEALSIAAFGWLVLTFVGSLPFSLSGYLSGLDGFFESMSGFTATGLTMFEDVESLPRSLLFWRSFTQWIGGVGVIVLFLSILIRSSGIAAKLYKAEGRTDRIAHNIVSTARRIWGIYILYTLLCILGLVALLGLNRAFDAVNIGMTCLATGGFAVTNDSIGAYGGPVAVFLIPFMLLGGISFASHRFLLKGRLSEFFTIEVKAILLIFFLTSFILVTRVGGLHSFFQASSALTGTGFSTEDLSAWDDFSKFILSILMVLGGGYGSTSSALKMIRVVIIIYAVAWVVKKFLYSRKAVIPFKVGRTTYPVEEIRVATLYSILYIIVLCLGALVFMAGGHSAADSLFEVASAEGNVGLSVGVTNMGMPAHEKVVLIIEMWVGRLEIFPVLTLLAVPFRKR
ncbi:MAG: TrkH family potassium uptake protein [Methanomassiliicoccales archaeon]|nr:MAG: TrkH family potassium uptake protein [Methanomassiliicoccales archaeon]